MRSLKTLFAAGALMCTIASAHAQPLSLNARDYGPAVPVAVGTVAGVGVYNGWWADAVHVPATGLQSIGASAAGGIVASAVFLTGYEAMVCKTFHADPLYLGCTKLSWRDPAWRGPRH